MNRMHCDRTAVRSTRTNRAAFVVFSSLALLLTILPSPQCAEASSLPRHLAVPSFENLTGEQRLDWIGEGFARTLVEKLNVIAELSAINTRAKGLYSDRREIDLTKLIKATGGLSADALIFGAVIKGADVDRLDDPLEITVRLVDIRTTEQIASLELVGKMRQLFSMEADLAARLAERLGITLSPAEEQLLRSQATRSLLAYKETILGTMYLEDGKWEQAIEMLEQAMEHHPGIFYPKAHHLLAQAYMRSGKKKEMLARFKKDAASLASVYYNLGVAQEFNGDPEEANKNFGLFLKYTDHRTLHWKIKEPGLELMSDAGGGVLIRDGGGAEKMFGWETGEVLTAGAAGTEGPPSSAASKVPEKFIPGDEKGKIAAGPVVSGDRFYYGLDNRYVIGRSTETGERTWAYRLAGVPRGKLVAGPGTISATDDQGNLYCLGTHEGPEPSDLSAYLKMAEIARRSESGENAEDLYRYIVEEVKYNVPPAWHALWEIARERGDTVAAAYRWESYQQAQY